MYAYNTSLFQGLYLFGKNAFLNLKNGDWPIGYPSRLYQHIELLSLLILFFGTYPPSRRAPLMLRVRKIVLKDTQTLAEALTKSERSEGNNFKIARDCRNEVISLKATKKVNKGEENF
jgi:hypothetical protein